MSTHDGWMTIREAALAWGVSELTVRRRIKDGKIASRLSNGKYFVVEGKGERTLASAERAGRDEEPVHRNEVAREADVPAPAAPAINLDAFVVEHRRLAEQAGRAALLQEQLQSLQDRYAQLQEGAVSLANRNGWLESKLDEREKEIKLLQDSQHRPSFWKRLFGG